MSKGPIILGLTGSIAMGKSETAKIFGRLGVPVFDADASVHQMLARGGEAVTAVSKIFPSVVREGAVDRRMLGDLVFGNSGKLRALELILHPLVARARKRFLRLAGGARTRVVVMDIPLLYETGGSDACHAVVVVSAPKCVQRSRALRRPGMSEKKFNSILEMQTPDHVKRRQADFIVLSGLGKRVALTRVTRVLQTMYFAQVSGKKLVMPIRGGQSA
ncbi:MAG: dephospho-CoA kinase [Pseudomonadota bacterium]|nr:dephospho-CoA kinase [Pseudomonadota bacterium]